MDNVSRYLNGIANNFRVGFFNIYVAIVHFSPLPDTVDAIILFVILGLVIYKGFKLLLAQ
jgi:hypothetical protein